MEEIDISDRNFKPCACGYQICRFCWHHIKSNLNGLCPACRKPYSDQLSGFKPISQEEIARMRSEKRRLEREKREQELSQRRHLNNMRVVQTNLVYVIGLPPRLANEEILRQHDYFGQYGKIVKIVINRRHTSGMGVYITYARKEDASKAIAAVDSTMCDGRIVRASNGTTKYCAYYLRGQNCTNPNCMYLHEPGDDAQSYTKEELIGRSVAHVVSSTSRPSTAPTTTFEKSNGRDGIEHSPGPGGRDASSGIPEESALPPTASWAKPMRSSSSSSQLSADDSSKARPSLLKSSSPPPGLATISNDNNLASSASCDFGLLGTADSISAVCGASERDASSFLKSHLEQYKPSRTPLEHGFALVPRYNGPIDPFDDDPLSILGRLPLSLLDNTASMQTGSAVLPPQHATPQQRTDSTSAAAAAAAVAARARINDPNLRNYLYNASILFGKPPDTLLNAAAAASRKPEFSGLFNSTDSQAGPQSQQQQQNALLHNLVRAQQGSNSATAPAPSGGPSPRTSTPGSSAALNSGAWHQWMRSGNPGPQSIPPPQRVLGLPSSVNGGLQSNTGFPATFSGYNDSPNLFNVRMGKQQSAATGKLAFQDENSSDINLYNGLISDAQFPTQPPQPNQRLGKDPDSMVKLASDYPRNLHY